MDVRQRAAEEMRREKAKNLRYEKPIDKTLNWRTIVDELYEIQSEIGDVQWMTDDEEILISLLDSEDEAFEFRIAFSDLASEAEKMQEDMTELQRYQQAYLFSRDSADEDDVPELFDLFFPAIDSGGDLYGYDEYEGDYFGLGMYESEYAEKTAKDRLKRLTKDQIIDLAGTCLRVAREYMALRYRHDCLKAALDILRGQNSELLQMVQHLEDLYEQACDETDNFKYRYVGGAIREFDQALSQLPDRLWIE